jgi:galactokinase
MPAMTGLESLFTFLPGEGTGLGRRSGQAERLGDLLRTRLPGGVLTEGVFLGFVPGRIEVLGKHTDYMGGHSIVCAMDRGFLFLARPNSVGRLRMVQESREFPTLDVPFDDLPVPRAGGWENYPLTIARRVRENFGAGRELRGVDIAFSSDLPVGSGMSGSSALMMMSFCAICLVNRLQEAPELKRDIRDGIDLAMYLACCENGQSFRGLTGGKGVGTFGGSEDHTAILNCREGCLSLNRYAPTLFKAEMAWPPDWGLAVAFSGVRAEKTREALEKYNRASLRAAAAVKAFNAARGTEHPNLGQAFDTVPAGEAARVLREIDARAAPDQRSMKLADRARMLLAEERRHMPAAVRAVLWGDLAGFGAALSASHRSSARFLENIVPEIDFLRRSAVSLGAAGATGFGAGFGGSCVAVLPSVELESFLAAWGQMYAQRFPAAAKEAQFFGVSPGAGITILDTSGLGRWVDRLFPR